MTHGSLFSGIGGFDLAAEWMGWDNKFHCEWNEFGQKVLHHYWPQAELFTDIKKSKFTKYANRIDVLSGGFPCQPYSSAGKRLGKEDDRHLWPEMLRAIKEISPSWVVGENVRGLTNWNGGVVFDEVQADLEAQGYEVTPFLLPACAVNAPHRRDRIWFVAHSKLCSNRLQSEGGLDMERSLLEGRERSEKAIRFNIITKDASDTNSARLQKARTEQQAAGFEQYGKLGWIATNTNGNGLNQRNGNNEVNASEGRFNALGNINESNGNGDAADTTNIRREDALENGELERGRFRQSYQRNMWHTFPSVSPICNGDDGLSDRLDSITFPKWRNESIKAGGNAVVPQVVYQIFKAIEQYDRIPNTSQNHTEA